MHDRLVPVRQKTKGAITICCAHGDEVTYPLAEVEISVSGCVLTVEAGVSRTLPASVLLVTDVPELMTLLHEAQEEVAQAKELKADEDMYGLKLLPLG